MAATRAPRPGSGRGRPSTPWWMSRRCSCTPATSSRSTTASTPSPDGRPAWPPAEESRDQLPAPPARAGRGPRYGRMLVGHGRLVPRLQPTGAAAPADRARIRHRWAPDRRRHDGLRCPRPEGVRLRPAQASATAPGLRGGAGSATTGWCGSRRSPRRTARRSPSSPARRDGVRRCAATAVARPAQPTDVRGRGGGAPIGGRRGGKRGSPGLLAGHVHRLRRRLRQAGAAPVGLPFPLVAVPMSDGAARRGHRAAAAAASDPAVPPLRWPRGAGRPAALGPDGCGRRPRR